MSGSKFSTSRGRVIYVGDFLREFGPDALRYFISVAGPETTDTDFTWDEFVRRTNFELANEWGNLVHRSISMAHKNNGAIPSPGATIDIDADLVATARAAFTTVGDCLAGTGSGRPSPRPCASLGRRQIHLGHRTVEARPRSRSPRHRAAHRACRVRREHLAHAVPAACCTKVHQALGGTGVWAAQPEVRGVTEEGAPDYP